jgi:transcriptional regulator with XRE-family HTH domain
MDGPNDRRRWPLGGRLRGLIRLRGLASESEAARSLGLHPNQLSGYLNGLRVPRPETLRRILDGLRAGHDDLLAAPDVPGQGKPGHPRRDGP